MVFITEVYRDIDAGKTPILYERPVNCGWLIKVLYPDRLTNLQ